MTEEEAKRAAATFEFPPFRAEALRTWIFTDPKHPEDFTKGYHTWGLHVCDPTGAIGPVGFHYDCDSAEEWLDFYAFFVRWQREHKPDVTS